MSRVENDENVSRLLFYARMIDDQGRIQKSAFPMSDIVQEKGRSVSVDRCKILGYRFHNLLAQKAGKFADVSKDRAKHGYCLAVAGKIRFIQGASGEQLFDILPDAIKQDRPDPWDCAHAKLVRANPIFSESYLRGYRDRLCELFSEHICLFEQDGSNKKAEGLAEG